MAAYGWYFGIVCVLSLIEASYVTFKTFNFLLFQLKVSTTYLKVFLLTRNKEKQRKWKI